jgi:SAM-dependent methyltransferase
MGDDPFGEAFRDYLDGKRPVLTIERDDGYTDEHDFEDYFAGFDQFPQCEKEALSFAKGRVLDIGLGAGRVSLHLSHWAWVTGIDISDSRSDLRGGASGRPSR